MPDHEDKYKEIRLTKANGDQVTFTMADPDCEPVFLLRGQDIFAAEAVAAYAHALHNVGLAEQSEHAFDHAAEMRHWHTHKRPD